MLGTGRKAIVFTTPYVMQWGAKAGHTVGLGHANIQNTLIYARVTTVKRDAEARRLFASSWVV
jgi:hypothetical protein